jgi:hypothetical protein
MNAAASLTLLAQDGGTGGTGQMISLVIILVLTVFVIAGVWKTFEKAGKPGWGAIVPIYNLILLLQIAGKPTWWLLLFLIPFLNIIFIVLTYIDVAKRFGKGAGFGLGLAFLGPIFFPILGFGDATYQR